MCIDQIMLTVFLKKIEQNILRFSFKSEKFVKVDLTVNVRTIFGMWNDDNEEIIGTLYLMLQHSYQSPTALHVMDAHATEKIQHTNVTLRGKNIGNFRVKE